VGVLAGALVILVFGLYMAAEPRYYLDHTVRLIAPRHRERGRDVLLSVGDTLKWWLVGKLLSMGVIGVLTWLGLWLLGIPLALVLAIVAALLTFVPNFGPFVAAVPAVLLAFLESPMKAFYVALLYVGVQLAETYLITPIIQRRTVRIPPALIISSQLLMGAVVGLFGVALATPLAAAAMVVVAKLYVEKVERNRLE
jgi:predicted PurR-regulated permease PerM